MFPPETQSAEDQGSLGENPEWDKPLVTQEPPTGRGAGSPRSLGAVPTRAAPSSPHLPPGASLTRFSDDLGAQSWARHRCALPRNWVTGPFTLKYIWMQSSLISGCPICRTGVPPPRSHSGYDGSLRAQVQQIPGESLGAPALSTLRPLDPWTRYLQGLLRTQNKQVGAEALRGVKL